jgi:hypothetical protein
VQSDSLTHRRASGRAETKGSRQELERACGCCLVCTTNCLVVVVNSRHCRSLVCSRWGAVEGLFQTPKLRRRADSKTGGGWGRLLVGLLSRCGAQISASCIAVGGGRWRMAVDDALGAKTDWRAGALCHSILNFATTLPSQFVWSPWCSPWLDRPDALTPCSQRQVYRHVPPVDEHARELQCASQPKEWVDGWSDGVDNG